MSDSDDNLPIAEFLKKRKAAVLLKNKNNMGKVVQLKRTASTTDSLFEDSTSFIPLTCSPTPAEAESSVNFIVVKEPHGDPATVIIVAKNAGKKCDDISTKY
jgi:hypothetical protein